MAQGRFTGSTVVVVGLGYVGLPLAIEAEKAGFKVVGVDISLRVVDDLRLGRPSTRDVSSEDLSRALGRNLEVTTDFAAVSSAEIVVICVPTPLNLDHTPDLSALRGAAESISKRLSPGSLVLLESTSFPGTTEEFLLPFFEKRGFLAEIDFFLAFSPERIDPGNTKFDLKNTPKLVGAIGPLSNQRARSFYEEFVSEVVSLSGTREAEMAKLLENTYRHINIALVNEMAKICHEIGVNIWEVIRGAATKPFGFHAFSPGAGVGGHCIPIDPNYLDADIRRRLGYGLKIIEVSQEINSGMPAYVVGRVNKILDEHGKASPGSAVLIHGISYKGGVADTRESPALELASQLLEQGASLCLSDPLVETLEAPFSSLEFYSAANREPASFDLAIVLHSSEQLPTAIAKEKNLPIFDCTGRLEGRNVYRL